MIFDGRVYSVLLVSASEKFNMSFEKLMPEATYSPVCHCHSAAAAKRELSNRNYDFIIINTPLPDGFGTELAVDICSKGNSICLLFASADIYADVNAKVISQGVMTLSKPASAQMCAQALSWMVSMRERLRKLEKKSASLEDKMQEIRIINRAKWVLIDSQNMSEQDAHRFIEKQAMDNCTTRVDIAKNIIKSYS